MSKILFCMMALAVGSAWLVGGCSSRAPGTCEKDSHCQGAQVCFEGKCMLMKEREEILKAREESAKPKVCQDKDGDGARAGSGCPKGEALDCNDNDPNMTPGKAEVCDEVDNNCNGLVNEGLKGCVQTLFGGATWGNQAQHRLEHPRSVLYDSAGFVLVTDDHHVWKIGLDGNAEVLAGSNVSNYADGPGANSRFSYPAGMVKGQDGSIFVADCKNNCVRKINSSGMVSTVAGQCSVQTKNTGQYADGPAASARFFCPSDVAVAPDGTLVVVDQGNARIRRISANGQVSTIAGVGPVEVKESEGQIGFLDGPALEARFNDPQAVLVDAKGNIFVSESFNCRIRKIDVAKGVVSTLAGSSDTLLGVGGFADGAGAAAKFNYPYGMVFDPQGNILVADAGNSAVRSVAPGGVVRTMYGKPSENKCTDGPIGKARFQTPSDLALGPNGSLFIVDGAANRLRWIVP